MRSILLVPDGLGFRNFICTRFAELLCREGPVEVWHHLPTDHLEEEQLALEGVERWVSLPVPRERPAERLLRQAKLFAQLYGQEAGSRRLLDRQRPPGRLGSRLLWCSSRGLGSLFRSQSGTRVLDRLHAAVALSNPAVEAERARLSESRPDVVFCTNQRSSLAVPTMLAAHREGIPTATFVHSWDNLPKGRMAVLADAYCVWSPRMRDEMERFYPDVSTERVHVTGTPQFECHFEPREHRSRNDFITELSLDPARPVICFSGDDATTSPFDPLYLRDVAQSLRTLPANRRPQLVFRRCPADTSPRYESVLAEFPEIARSEPRWRAPSGDDWQKVLPLAADGALLARLAASCDLVVNIGSTMAIDFAIAGKPAIFLAYDHAGANGTWRTSSVYALPHFELIHRTDPVHWVRRRERLAEVITAVLDQPAAKELNRRRCLAELTMAPLDRASERTIEALRKVASGSVRPSATRR